MANENIADKNMTSSPKLRILLVHNRYKLRGGEDSVFEAERDMLIAAGHNVHIYEVTNDTISENTSKFKLFIDTIWNKSSYKKALEIINEFKPDVVHCHNTFPLISPSIYYACDKAGVPVVQTLHNYRLTCLNGYLFREQECQLCEKCLGKSPIRGIFKKCYRNSLAASATVAAMLIVHRILGTYRKKVTKYIALSHFAKYNFTKKCGLPEDKVVVKPNIVTLPKEVPQLHKEKNVLFIGRISPEKGVKTLISAWSLLKDTFGFKLIIIGDGPEKDTLSQKYQNNKSISFLGGLPHDEVIIQLTKASLLVFPSILYEQFAITPIEAMSQATPVLVSDIAKNATIVQDNISGRYFKAGDINDLAAKLAELLSDTNKLITLGSAAKAAFEQSDCSTESNLRALEAIYHSILAHGK
ncbi:MAG: glycosyltransferase family 4 protein [Kiritimatiellae bacterium]|nr:glycosyltransferase family 4 protein [Kiritimatiellia bacterium]